MRRFLALCGAVLCFSVGAAAQDGSAAPAIASSTTVLASPARYPASELPKWQIGINYQYVRFRSGTSFGMHGFNTSITRYANEWFGLEGDVGAVFGDTPSSGGPGPFVQGGLRAKLLVYAAGPHLAYRRSDKVEPWVHAVFGGAHFRFTQTGPPTANLSQTDAFAYAVGGGFDFRLGPHVFWRVQGDFLGTRFFDTWQKNVSAQSGLVFNF